MNREHLDRLARAVLYEGYILYPYRPSVKNHQRWTFGSLYPPEYEDVQRGTERSALQVECLLHGSATRLREASVSVMVRFLHLQARTVGQVRDELPGDGSEPAFTPVDQLHGEGRVYQSWQEAAEEEYEWRDLNIANLSAPVREMFRVPGRRTWEAVAGGTGVLVREQCPVEGSVDVAVTELNEELVRLRVRVQNETPLPGSGARAEATLRVLAATHVVLQVCGAEFLSSQDPPEFAKQAAATCQNVGAWPILVGEPGERDTMLAPPIILYDYPEIAPESPGDLFDGTEIDEILTLRILTLTDDEKRAVGAIDAQARALLQRSEALSPEQMLSLHGRLRPARENADE
jgi:hypothetical protein